MNRIFRSKILILITILIAVLIFYGLLEFFYNILDTLGIMDQEQSKKWMRIVLILVEIAVWLAILFKNESLGRKMSLIVFMTLNAVFAVILYLTLGRKFTNSRRYRNRPKMHGTKYINQIEEVDFESEEYNDSDMRDVFKVSHSISKHEICVKNTKVTILNNGDEKFPCLIEKLKKAEKFIFMEYYIIKTDRIGKEVLDILLEKAEAGVEVKLLYDFFGGLEISNGYFKKLISAGVQIKVFDKFVVPLGNTKLNYRLHRKMTIIDSKYGFIGGINLGDEYLHRSKKYGFWRDTHLLLEGKANNTMTNIFLKDWYYITNEFINDSKYYQAEAVESDGLTQIIQSGPDSELPIIRDTYLKMLTQAKKSIKIVTPYLVPDDVILAALKMQAAQEIDVEIIIPGKPDKMSIYKATESYIQTLMQSGCKIYKYDNRFVHSKILIIDNKIASVGTANLDFRSFVINFEATVLFTGKEVEKLIAYFEDDKLISTELDLEEWKKRSIIRKFFESIFNMFSTLV